MDSVGRPMAEKKGTHFFKFCHGDGFAALRCPDKRKAQFPEDRAIIAEP
jgi:hypothetical protein